MRPHELATPKKMQNGIISFFSGKKFHAHFAQTENAICGKQ